MMGACKDDECKTCPNKATCDDIKGWLPADSELFYKTTRTVGALAGIPQPGARMVLALLAATVQAAMDAAFTPEKLTLAFMYVLRTMAETASTAAAPDEQVH
jgi:hypothetical protein